MLESSAHWSVTLDLMNDNEGVSEQGMWILDIGKN